MFYNRFSMLLHLDLMAFPTTFYLRSLMSKYYLVAAAAKTSKFDVMGEIWLQLFFVSFGNAIPQYVG